MHQFVKLAICSVVLASTLWLASSGASAEVAVFDVIQEQTFRDWKMYLYRNRNGGRFFCAAETKTRDGSLFRLNVYRSTQDAFVEFFNEKWTLEKGKVRFQLKVDSGNGLELDGESWGDSLIYDQLDAKILLSMFGMLFDGKTAQLLDANKTTLAQFSLNGAKEASRSMFDCFFAK